MNSKKKFAFTLAEVLITLGIIGVVAAITIPALIHNYQKSVLENSFKKFNANLISAYNCTKKDFEIDDMNKYLSSNYPTGNYYTTSEAKDFDDTFISYFKQATKINMFNDRAKYGNLTSYSGLKFPHLYYQAYGIYPYANPYNSFADCSYFILPDGSAVSRFDFQHHNPAELTLTFDTNGPGKGPNQYGYDMFIYGPGVMWYPLCSKNSTDSNGYNGRGCYNYAMQDKNPDDPTKTYWDSLY